MPMTEIATRLLGTVSMAVKLMPSNALPFLLKRGTKLASRIEIASRSAWHRDKTDAVKLTLFLLKRGTKLASRIEIASRSAWHKDKTDAVKLASAC